MDLWFESSGTGPGLLFLHAAVGDSRMWDPQWRAFAQTYSVVRCDLRGFGRTGLQAGTFSHCEDVLLGLDRLEIESIMVIGASMGGRVAMELAVAAPDRVDGLVLVGAVLPGHNWSEAVEEFGHAEDEAMERGDIEAAVELNLSFWLDGSSRQRADVSDETRAFVADMQRTAIHHFLPHLHDSREHLAVTDLPARLSEINTPTLVIVGDHDAPDLVEIANTLASSIRGADLHVIGGTAHLPSLESPDAFNALLTGFAATASS